MSALDRLDILDLSGEIATLRRQRGCETLPPRTAEQFITFHYSGVVYQDRTRAAELARILDEARYHLAKNWGSTQRIVYADRMMYDFVVLTDGTIVNTQPNRAQLWHAGNAIANARSWSVHVMLGGTQDLTAAQRASLFQLFDALRADGAMRSRATSRRGDTPKSRR
ncbi:N-acetylmuramoyl-L-alanine amidase [Kallotenue papyrolyticum]|uniref:peptidoglycan recognition protein family protein n=1 Tax=Kallotenue papyrolyticum TaxID=1325125 RepID=UPI0009DCDFDE